MSRKDKPDQKLNLPHTSFPMRAGLPRLEPEICRWWDSDAFRAHLKDKLAGRDRKFLLHDGPPYANGDIHTGHAINKVLKDIVVKSHWLDGTGGLYVPGWDCHGLPIELKVEEQLGTTAAKVGRAQFRKACRDYAMEQVENQKRGFLRLGVRAEWDQPYLTADPVYEANMLRALAQIVRRGHLKRGQKPVHWCTACQSALAEAEVEYRERKSTAVDVAFVADSALAEVLGLPADTQVQIAAWTTTPWTLPANQALCVHPELTYCALRPTDSQTWTLVAEGLIDAAAERCNWRIDERTAAVPGSKIAGLTAAHPFQPRRVPLIAADHVTLEVGTGIVHTAPAHGLDDWRVGERHDLDLRQLVQPDGTYVEEVADFAGMHVHRAEKAIIEQMADKGTLLSQADYPHSYPHCWRHGRPLIFRSTPQWFIGMQEAALLTDAVAAADGVEFVPESGRERFLSMLRDRPDWCISRQRTWGVPLALFQHQQSGQAHPRTAELMEQVADLVERDGLDAWDELDATQLIGADASEYQKCPDVLDVWFDSGISHHCVLDMNEQLGFPADMYLEGSDQHRGWFQSSMLTSVAMGKGAPYRTLLTHGFLVDETGAKMSKSRGNGLLPDEIWDKWGADILRLWIASSDYRGEMVLSQNILAATADIYRKIRNTIRFMIGNLYDFQPPEEDRLPPDLTELDRWALERTAEVQQTLKDEYGRYRLQQVCRTLHDFCSADMGAFYLDILKDRLYTCKTDGPARTLGAICPLACRPGAGALDRPGTVFHRRGSLARHPPPTGRTGSGVLFHFQRTGRNLAFAARGGGRQGRQPARSGLAGGAPGARRNQPATGAGAQRQTGGRLSERRGHHSPPGHRSGARTAGR